ncbi:MAG: thiamine phosphate synthase [Campylobacteraceae bacterium]
MISKKTSIKYLITDTKLYSKDFFKILKNALLIHKPDFACFRDKTSNDYEAKVEEFIFTCKSLHVKPILHTRDDLALKYKAFGVHFSSQDFHKIKNAKENGLFVVSSTHSLYEAKEAINLGSDFIIISPIFFTPNKGEPLGLVNLKEITDKIPNQCIALGGILENSQIDDCLKAGAVGFASIRYFIKN